MDQLTCDSLFPHLLALLVQWACAIQKVVSEATTRWASPRHYTVDPMLLPSGNPFRCHEEVLYLQPMIPPKRFDIFSPLTGGCSEGLGAF